MTRNKVRKIMHVHWHISVTKKKANMGSRIGKLGQVWHRERFQWNGMMTTFILWFLDFILTVRENEKGIKPGGTTMQ